MAASTRSIHSRQRAAGGRSTSSTSRVSSPSRRRRRAAALIGRTAGTWAARKIRGRRRARPAGRTAGGRRGRSSARGGRLRRARRNLGRATGRRFSAAGLARSLGATAIRVFGAAGEIGGEVEGGGGGEGDRACGGVWPGGVAWPWPPPSARRPQARVQNFRGDQRHGPRPAQPEGDDACRTPRGRGFRLRPPGRPGRRENTRAAALAAAETGSPSPAQAFRLAARPFGSTARSSRAAASRIRPGSRLGGRPARSRHSDRSFAAGPSGSPTAKRRSRSAASSALRRRILAEAAALCSARRERSAPAAGGSPRRTGVEQGEAGPGGEQGIALPCPSARPRPGRNRRRRRKGLVFRGFRRFGLGSRRACGGAGRPPGGRRGGSGTRSRSARITWRMMNSWRRFVTLLWRGIRPACRGVGMSDNLTLSDMIREPAQTPCQTPQNQAVRPSQAPREAAPEAIFDPAEASENTARRLSGDPPALNARLGEAFNRPHPKPLDRRAEAAPFR